MTIPHATIADPYIHEPKGVASASAGTVYVATGGGSGVWETLGLSSIDMAALSDALQVFLDTGELQVTGDVLLTAVIPDVSTAGSVLIPIPGGGEVTTVVFTLAGPITTADAVVSVLNSSGASMGSPITIAEASSAKGDTYTFTATGNNVLPTTGWIEVSTNGASSGAQPLFVTAVIRRVLN